MGFCCKSHIDALFRKQKAAMRAIMPGRVLYKYKDGENPTHTKSSFSSYKVLTIQGIITKNALLFMFRIKFLKSSLPSSISDLIPCNAPCFSDDQDHITHKNWLDGYGNAIFKDSIFFKGPLLALSSENETILSNFKSKQSSPNLCTYKSALKKFLMEAQGGGDNDEWPNFLLNNVKGLRQSARNQKSSKT